MASRISATAARITRSRAPYLAIAAVVAGLAQGPSAGIAAAQGFDWLKGIPGFGTATSERHRPAKAETGAQAPQDDLRPDKTPMRSEQMLVSLSRAIDAYSQIAARGGWQPLKSTRLIRPGDDDERVAVARRRLQITGEFRGSTGGFSSYNFDGDLESAVRLFQKRHGLRVSGRLDGPTIQAMNVPVQARIAQLQQNYRRIERLIGQRTEDRYILVNVPAFQLEAVANDVVEQRHRVIAGKPERQTPEVRAEIRALNFFPFWKVPESVAKLDLIPRLRREPDYLDKEKIRVLDGSFVGPEVDRTAIDWNAADTTRIRFRQDPGPQNALGLVRLDMPNEHGVYMHDTPLKPLFGQRSRAFSAGCVRVQDVFDLAAWIAREQQDMNRQKVEEILQGGQAVDIVLQRPVPVYFTYITAWVEKNGSVEFRPDIYGRDGVNELASDRERDPDAPVIPTQGVAP
ncbi:MAG: L,D-transpeptidase family protein [Hyphomicrobiaceae bacterium]